MADSKSLLSEYDEKVVKRGRVDVMDTLILSINYRCIEMIASEGESLYKSVSDLVLYATGAAACSTADLMVVMEAINASLDRIEAGLNKAYFKTWRYVQLRIGYWKEVVYRQHSKQELIGGAFLDGEKVPSYLGGSARAAQGLFIFFPRRKKTKQKKFAGLFFIMTES